MKKTRLFICSADICRMAPLSERSARALLSKIRSHYNKRHYQFVSVAEFCEYTGCREEQVVDYLL